MSDDEANWITAEELQELNRQMEEFSLTGRINPRVLQPVNDDRDNRPQVIVQWLQDGDDKENLPPPRQQQTGEGLTSTTADELYQLAKRFEIPGFAVYSSDTLPKKLKKKSQSFIINVDKLLSGRGGTHWVCLYAGPKQKEVVYVDPFGVDAQPSIIKLMKTIDRPAIGSTTQVQHIKADSCGQWCIYMLHKLSSGIPLSTILAELDTPSRNEKMLSKFIN